MNILEREIIFELRDKPGLVHCSDHLEVKPNSFICVWYQGSYETSSDTVLMISRKDANTEWSKPEVAIDFNGAPLGNPVLWQTSQNKRVYLTFSVLTAEDWKSSLLFYTFSEDLGKTWASPSLFISKAGFMAKTKPVENEKGEIVFPIYHEETYCPYIYVIPDINNPLKSYLSAETMARGKAIQPALSRLKDNQILMVCRTKLGYIWESISFNSGYSWSILQPTQLENPDSGVDLFSYNKNEVGLVYNPSKNNRNQLAVAKRNVNGKTWDVLGVIEEGEGEYSYPSAIVQENGNISITFTDSRFAIRRIVILP